MSQEPDIDTVEIASAIADSAIVEDNHFFSSLIGLGFQFGSLKPKRSVMDITLSP